jgi:hypothetical protein
MIGNVPVRVALSAITAVGSSVVGAFGAEGRTEVRLLGRLAVEARLEAGSAIVRYYNILGFERWMKSLCCMFLLIGILVGRTSNCKHYFSHINKSVKFGRIIKLSVESTTPIL